VEGAVRLGAWVPFERLPDLLRWFTGADLGATTIRRLTETAGAAYVAVQTADVARLERECPAPPAGPPVQQVSVDGAMVPLRGAGEWAEVKTLAIGTVQPPVLSQEGEPEVHVTELSYFSRMTDAETFGRLATVETHRRGVETAGTVCGVVDGAEWCQAFLALHRPDAVRILDFPHAAGYLAQVAQATFGAGTAASAWLDAQRHALKHGAPAAVLAAVRAARDRVAADGDAAARAVVETSLAYLEKRRAQLAYAAFQAQGYPIGSGIVESANKLVVEARLKGAGMHWAREHVDPIVALRTIACSDRWAEAWPQLVQQVRTQHRAAAAQRRVARATRRAVLLAPPAPGPAPAGVAPGARPRQPAPTVPPPATEAPALAPRRPAANHPWRRRAVLPKPSLQAA
jgi:hypothetical protein